MGTLTIVESGVVHDKGRALIAGNCTSNGDLLVSYNTGGDLSAGQRVEIVRSRDGGHTWSVPLAPFESVFVNGGIEAGCSLTCLSSGRLLLPYTDGFYLHPGEDFDRRGLLFCLISDDGGASWSNQKAQHYEALESFCSGPVVELSDDTLLLPTWGAYDKQGVHTSGVLRSTDQGETWGQWRPIVREHGDETPLLQLPDGQLLALLRGLLDDPKVPFHVSYSQDSGATWSDPQIVNINGTSPSLYLTASGLLLAGYRSTVPGGNCHVSSSLDGGLTWQFELELQLPRETWSYGGYPVFENLPDNRLLATFHNAKPSWYVAYNILEVG